MKRKNILWGWAVVVVAMIFCWAFSSCGDDKKEEPQNPLFGAWEIDADAEKLLENLEKVEEGEMTNDMEQLKEHLKLYLR